MIVARETLVDIVRDRAATLGDEIWLRYLATGDVTGPIVELSYAELERRARAVAAELQQRGAPGDRALLLFPSGLPFVTAFFGCLFAGMIPVPAYPPDLAKPERALAKLYAIAADCGARFAVTTSEFLPMLERIAPPNTQCLAVDRCEAGTWHPPAIAGDSVALLQYTSGSTGAPKGVVLEHRHLIANEISIDARMGPVKLLVGWLPIFHDMGLIGTILHSLCGGSGLVLMSPVDFLKRPARWLEAISHFRATTSGGPNFAYDLCVRRVTEVERAGLDLASWHVAFCGAEPVREATYRRFCAAFEPHGFSRAAFYPCYGLAEASLFVAGKQRGTAPTVVVDADGNASMSCGLPAPTEEIRIVDPERRTPTDGVGEIWVRGPGVARGYWGRDSDDVFRARTADGDGPFLRTGDLGFLHGGELHVAGRLKDLIIIAGRNLFPQDIEAVVEAAVPAIRKGCCAAYSIEHDGEEKLCITAEHDGSAELETVRAVKQAVSAACQVVVHDVILVGKGAIPKTSSGKLERYACRRAHRRS